MEPIGERWKDRREVVGFYCAACHFKLFRRAQKFIDRYGPKATESSIANQLGPHLRCSGLGKRQSKYCSLGACTWDQYRQR